MKWLLVTILVAPAADAQKDHSRVFETHYDNRKACLDARSDVLGQYKVNMDMRGQMGPKPIDKSLIHVTCIPQNDGK